MIKSDKPLIIFDLETTGVDITHDRIVEIGFLLIKPDGTKELKSSLVNPTIPIAPEATEVHGITNEMVKDKPTFAKLAIRLYDIFKDADLGGFNSNRFDVPILIEEFKRVGINFDVSGKRLLDAYYIFKEHEKRDLTSAYKFYCNKELEDAHSAKADLMATYEILNSQINKYEDIENDIDSVHQASNNPAKIDLAEKMVVDEKGVVLFNFGKHKGRSVIDVFKNEHGYYNWLMKSDFTSDTKAHFKKIHNSMM